MIEFVEDLVRMLKRKESARNVFVKEQTQTEALYENSSHNYLAYEVALAKIDNEKDPEKRKKMEMMVNSGIVDISDESIKKHFP